MPELMQTGRERQLVPGDVLMVSKKIVKPKFGDRPYWWRFFFVVTKHRKWFVRGLILGSANEKLKGKEISVEFDDVDEDMLVVQISTDGRVARWGPRLPHGDDPPRADRGHRLSLQ
jgi:hypothetical protein